MVCVFLTNKSWQAKYNIWRYSPKFTKAHVCIVYYMFLLAFMTLGPRPFVQLMSKFSALVIIKSEAQPDIFVISGEDNTFSFSFFFTFHLLRSHLILISSAVFTNHFLFLLRFFMIRKMHVYSVWWYRVIYFIAHGHKCDQIKNWTRCDREKSKEKKWESVQILAICLSQNINSTNSLSAINYIGQRLDSIRMFKVLFRRYIQWTYKIYPSKQIIDCILWTKTLKRCSYRSIEF